MEGSRMSLLGDGIETESLKRSRFLFELSASELLTLVVYYRNDQDMLREIKVNAEARIPSDYHGESKMCKFIVERCDENLQRSRISRKLGRLINGN
jgi:hypothetical protein